MSRKNGGKRSTSTIARRSDASVWKKAFTRNSQWEDKEQFLDVIYWIRQILGVIVGIALGLTPLKGYVGLASFLVINSGLPYLYMINFQAIDYDDYGGLWELTKEGFALSMAGFLMVWTVTYTVAHQS